MKQKTLKKALVCLVCGGVFTLAALLGAFYHPDQMLSDALYQSPKALDGNIFVIGIDDRAMEDIGPYQTWGRDVMAMAIEALNADPDCRPAASSLVSQEGTGAPMAVAFSAMEPSSVKIYHTSVTGSTSTV